MFLRKVSWLLLVAMLAGVFAACAPAPAVPAPQEAAATEPAEAEEAAQVEAEPVAQEPQYRFVMVSHIGSNDPNMQWLTRSLETFEEKYPDVETEYIATNEYSVQAHVQLIRQALATNPDGLAVPIVSSEAFEPVLMEAIEAGIPVVAFNIPDTRPAEERIPYLTYVGGDEYLTGLLLGQHAIAKAEAGEIPQPTGVVCANHDAAHQGLKARCQGMADAMAEIGVESQDLFIGAEPEQARSTLEAFLSASDNENVNYIFNVASWSSPWSYSVAADLGLSPDVDTEGVTIITVDASPIALEGIKQGKLLSTHSQGFWLQGFLTMEWLYWFHTLGYLPQSDMLTGPTVVDSTDIDSWIERVRNTFGEEYDNQTEAVWE